MLPEISKTDSSCQELVPWVHYAALLIVSPKLESS